jgi:membrane-associated protease RseP (regulator of RpoE activity)
MNIVYFFDIIFLVVFSLAVSLFLYTHKKNLKKDGIMYLYRTSVGLKLIDSLGKKYPKTLKVLSYVSVFCGYLLVIASFYVVFNIISAFTNAEFVKAIKVPPIMPLIPYLPELFKIDVLPPFYFTYWILAIATIALFHEGFHGIFARFYGVKIKSTGFGFLGPFLAFFVEQDDKQMTKKKIFPQLTILSSGVFANLILTFVFFFLLIGFASTCYEPAGYKFQDYSFNVLQISNLTDGNLTMLSQVKVNGNNFTKIRLNNENYLIDSEIYMNRTNLAPKLLLVAYYDLPAINAKLEGVIVKANSEEIKSSSDMSLVLSTMRPGDKIKITTFNVLNQTEVMKEYNLTLGTDYDNSSKPALGVASLQLKVSGLKGLIYKLIYMFKDASTYYAPKFNPAFALFIYNLIWWLALINLSVAVCNMLPMGIFDGGRFFYLSVLAVTKSKKIAEKSFTFMTWLILGLLAITMVLWFVGMFL